MNSNKEKFSNHAYVKVPGNVGNRNSTGDDVIWENVKDIEDNHYVSKTVKVGSNFEAGSDIETLPFSQCDTELNYIPEGGQGIVGNSTTLGRDTICLPLTDCDYETQYIVNEPVKNQNGFRTTDNECVNIDPCEEYQDRIRPTGPAKMREPGNCQPKGNIVIKIEMANMNDIYLKKKIYTGPPRSEFTNIQSIKDYFSKMKTSEDLYKNYINKENEFFFAMDETEIDLLGSPNNQKITAFYKSYNGFVAYLLDLRNEAILDILLKNHLYLEISFIGEMANRVDGPIYLLILGNVVSENSPMKLFNADNVIFSLVYKDQDTNDPDNTTEYKFDLIKYDLGLFYDYNKETAISQLVGNTRNLDIFLKVVLFSTSLPKYKMQLYNKKGKDLFFTITVYLTRFANKVLNISQAQKSISRCDFEPEGETLFGCKNRCMSVERCGRYDCNLICENCENDNCLWTIKYQIDKDVLSPDSVIVKGFSGDTLIKLTWMKPQSPSLIEKYYIIVSSPIDKDLLDIYSVQDNRDLCEYIISDLTNDKPYDIYVIVKNDIGISEKSNKVTVVPNKDSGMNIDDSDDSYSNSIENYYKQKKGDSFSLRRNISNFEKKAVINDLKKIIKDELKIKVPTESYNINIF